VRLLRTQLWRASYFRYGGVGSIPTVRSNIEAGASSSSGPSSCPYAAECVEEVGFCELRPNGVLRTSQHLAAHKQQQIYAIWGMCRCLRAC
jgi:hypothetical protein